MKERVRIVVFSLLMLSLTGCSTTTMTNLTPSRLPRKDNNQYTFEVDYNTRQQSLIQESMQGYVIVDGERYPMQRVPMLNNRWEGIVPVPPDQEVVTYRYRFDYQYRGIPEARRDSKESSYHQLFILDMP
jgi:hypothetical protein